MKNANEIQRRGTAALNGPKRVMRPNQNGYFVQNVNTKPRNRGENFVVTKMMIKRINHLDRVDVHSAQKAVVGSVRTKQVKNPVITREVIGSRPIFLP
ncbi:MAG: hypothetical protein VB054_09240, partial [Petrimonas sp.]|nr:hypothetical protein [Petrimonas sp.]